MTSRRQVILLGSAGAAVAAGAGVAMWREPAAGSAASAAPDELWAQRFAKPDGGELVMADFRGTPLVINFWATWCPPCVRELPEIDRFAREHSRHGVRVIGLALDAAEPVRAFLKRVPLSLPVALAGLDGSDLVRTLGNAQGGLPFTVMFAAGGRLIERKLGETSYSELAAWLKRLPAK